jgi:undecaprenyl diphosphate synthase
MDGNGRWAQRRRRPRTHGHIRGTKSVRAIVEESRRIGIKFLTLYAFSHENWQRPDVEVGLLMRLLERYLRRELKTLCENNIRLNCIGDTSQLPSDVRELLYSVMSETEQNGEMTLTLALSYGSRQEILRAANRILEDAQSYKGKGISEEEFSKLLWTKDIPDPDLIIRTSGECRLSNFLLWQAAYAELYIADICWPDFREPELHKALEEFANRERRFGKTSAQVQEGGGAE